MEYYTLNGNEPHPDWGGWAGFLSTCEKRGEENGVIYFGKTNCNYLVFPDGLIIENYGYHGQALMHRIREEGAEAIRSEVKKFHKELQALLKR